MRAWCLDMKIPRSPNDVGGRDSGGVRIEDEAIKMNDAAVSLPFEGCLRIAQAEPRRAQLGAVEEEVKAKGTGREVPQGRRGGSSCGGDGIILERVLTVGGPLPGHKLPGQGSD